MGVFKQSFHDRNGKKKQSKNWYFNILDHNSVRRRFPGFTDKKLTTEMARKIERLVSLRSMNLPYDPESVRWLESISKDVKDRLARYGIISKSVSQGAMLNTHLDEFKQYLKVSKNNAPRSIRESAAKIKAIMDDCGFTHISDFSTTKLARFFDKLQEKGIATRTRNHYLASLKSFCTWMIREGRMTENPFAHLKRLNASTDLRRQRRALSPEEFSCLIQSTKNNKTICGFSGMDRAMLYQLGAYSGLRSAELASITEDSLDFTSTPPTVTVLAAYSKNRKQDTLPLHAELAKKLQQWMLSKKENEAGPMAILPINGSHRDELKHLWPGTWAKRRQGAEMLRADLEAAEIPYIDQSGRYYDFHSLRVQFISNLGRSGVSLTVAQKLARHSDPALTANIYSHLRIVDLNDAVSSLPSLPEDADEKNCTGTEH